MATRYMHPGNVLSGVAFKTAVWSLICFLLILVLTGTVLYKRVASSMQQEFEAQILEELVLFKAMFDKGGQTELMNAINQLEQLDLSNQRIAGLFDNSGQTLAGDLQIAPDFVGWKRLKITPHNSESETNQSVVPYYARTDTFNDTTIIIGRNTQLIDATIKALVLSLCLAGIVVVATTLLIGYWLSRHTFTKLEKIATTLDKVSSGDTVIRLPVSQSNDQIDRVSRHINLNLDRLALLMDSTRNTVTAISHDLKTPLNNVFFTLREAIDKQESGENVLELLESVDAKLLSISEIFDTILRISRIESSDDKKTFEVIPVSMILSEILEAFQPVIESSGQTLIYNNHSTDDLKIFGDQRMLKQMLANLIENAIQYCHRGATIELCLIHSSAGGAVIEVNDNGPGIAIEKRLDALKPFFRADTSRSTPGTGLGLALVNAIVARHGASIMLLDNAPGLRVSIDFPAVPNLANA